MTGYRIAGEPAPDPLEVDQELCARQRWRQRLAIHLVATFITVGLWLPGLLIWLVISSGSTKSWADGYFVRVDGGTLTAGNAVELRHVPLDVITDIAVRKGVAIVTGHDTPPLQLYGLRDPIRASRTILEARDTYLRARGERGSVRDG